jgi:putative multicomponent Na+:H+ antiporter subunit B
MNDLADSYIYVLAALLPLSASMVVFQANPYHALVVRGMLGAVAAMVYAVLGAADVALTEALMGTMLAITLYAIAVRSSLVMRLGILEGEGVFGQLLDELRAICSKRHMRVEQISYADRAALQQALTDKEVHATCIRLENEQQPYQTAIAVKRLYDIMQAELSPSETSLTYVNAKKLEEKH